MGRVVQPMTASLEGGNQLHKPKLGDLFVVTFKFCCKKFSQTWDVFSSNGTMKLVLYKLMASQPSLLMPPQLDIEWDAFATLETPNLGILKKLWPSTSKFWSFEFFGVVFLSKLVITKLLTLLQVGEPSKLTLRVVNLSLYIRSF